MLIFFRVEKGMEYTNKMSSRWLELTVLQSFGLAVVYFLPALVYLLQWLQVSDLQGWENRASELYGVRSIPHTVLISPDGIIIEKNLRGDALRAKIAELLAS